MKLEILFSIFPLCLIAFVAKMQLQMNLENSFGGEKADIKVLDRTALILDIFAQHARTKEGKLQVTKIMISFRLKLCFGFVVWAHHMHTVGFDTRAYFTKKESMGFSI